jgi:hypothetical protein
MHQTPHLIYFLGAGFAAVVGHSQLISAIFTVCAEL